MGGDRQMPDTNFITINLGSGDVRSVLVVDVNKLRYLTYKPETGSQTAKLVLDFGASQKMFEKAEAEQAYTELMKHPSISINDNYR
jgi:hypothetical protein